MNKPLKRTQEEEMKLARKENRQPRCVSCGELLDCVAQTQNIVIVWNWNKEKKCYEKDDTTHGDADKPVCDVCDYPCWDFIDHDFIDF